MTMPKSSCLICSGGGFVNVALGACFLASLRDRRPQRRDHPRTPENLATRREPMSAAKIRAMDWAPKNGLLDGI
jgi:hypothetical protein